MPRRKQFLLLVAALVVVAAVAFFAYQTPPPSPPRPRPQPRELGGLAWLPAESGLVAGVDLAAMRRHRWLLELVDRMSEDEVAPDYEAFVRATGFDYSRDLDRAWLGVRGSSAEPQMAGVAEGRFDRQKILTHARRQNARSRRHRGFAIYQVRTEFRLPPTAANPDPKTRVGSFAFAFLEAGRLAFGTQAGDVARVIDCWQGAAPCLAGDNDRRSELERLAAGRQAWLVDDLDKWRPLALRGREAMLEVLQQASVGLRVQEQGMEVEATARCHQPDQAERLHDNLRVLALAGRLALARESGPLAEALSEMLGELALEREESLLRARVFLSPDLAGRLLDASQQARAAE